MQGEDDNPQKSRKWLEDMSNGLSHELEALTLGGIQIEDAQKGLIRCRFLIPKHLSVTMFSLPLIPAVSLSIFVCDSCDTLLSSLLPNTSNFQNICRTKMETGTLEQ